MGLSIGISLGFGQRRRTFTPAFIFAASEPGVWIDPSDPAALFSDTAGTTQAGIGDPVALVLDKSGNGNHATQPTLASRPILREAGGLRYLEFDGVDDFLVTTTITPGTDKVQMFAGVRKLGEAGTFRALAEFGPNVGSNNGSFLVSAPSGSADHYRFRVSGTTLGDNLGNAGAEYAGASTDVLAVVADILTDVHSLRINGAEIESSSSGLGAGNFLEYPLNIGARNGASNFFHGRIYSLFTRFGPNLDTPTTERTERYVAKRTGVSL